MPSYDAHPFSEKLTTLKRIFARYGLNGVVTVMKNEQVFYRTVLQGKLGYALFKKREKLGLVICVPPSGRSITVGFIW